MYFLFLLFPLEKSPFIKLSKQEIKQEIKKDNAIITSLNRKLESQLKLVSKQEILSIDFKNISEKEMEEMEDFWISYVEGLIEFDLIKSRYKSFYQINSIGRQELQQKAFLNGYTSLLSQHYYTLQIVKKTQNPDTIKFFNQSFPKYGIQQGTFDLLKNKLTASNELTRINAGRVYYSTIPDQLIENQKLIEKYLTNKAMFGN